MEARSSLAQQAVYPEFSVLPLRLLQGHAHPGPGATPGPPAGHKGLYAAQSRSPELNSAFVASRASLWGGKGRPRAGSGQAAGGQQADSGQKIGAFKGVGPRNWELLDPDRRQEGCRRSYRERSRTRSQETAPCPMAVPPPSHPPPPIWLPLHAWPRAWGAALAGARGKPSARAGGEDPYPGSAPQFESKAAGPDLTGFFPPWKEGPSHQHPPKARWVQCLWVWEGRAQVDSGMRSRTGLRPRLEISVSPSPSCGEV